MKTRSILVISAVIVIAGLTYWLASPLFINVTVEEQSPKSPEGSSSAVLLRGIFVDADDFHKASGKASILSVNGSSLLRLEDFRVTNGPDLFVYLAANPRLEGGFVDLGGLKGNIGNQNYEIPQGTDLSRGSVVVIWCRAFSVLFGYAELN
jgi:hypothetical protein